MSLLTILIAITSLLTDTSRTDLFVTGQFGQGTHLVEGKQTGGFEVKAQSVYDINTTSRVFGEASYRWSDYKATTYVDNADFRLTSPYLTVDTLGGDMRREVYSFYGGYRMLKNNIIWHAALGFRAEQSYRMRDPRAKDKVSDLRIEAGIGYKYSDRYALYLMAYGGRYKQTNEVRFYSELGETTIYHMVTETEPYSRFSSNNKISYYSGYRAGTSVSLLPTTGFLASLSYDWIRFTKELTINTEVPINRMNIHTVSAQLGYIGPMWRVVGSAGLEMKRGEIYLYGDNSNNYYQLLLISPNYKRNSVLADLYGDYRLLLPVGDMLFAANVKYDMFLTHLTESIKLQYTFPIRGKYKWFIAPSADLHQYAYRSTQPFMWKIALSTGLTF